MRLTTARLMTMFVLSLALLGSACSGSDGADPAESYDASPTAGPGAASDGSASPTSTVPGWVADALDEQESTRYIANTGGVGVSHRSACQTDARIDGVWPEGTKLQIVLDSETDCDDWSLLTDGDITSWVADKFLSSTPPTVGSAPAASAGSSGSSSQVQVIEFFGNLIPTAQLRTKPATYTYNNTVLIAGCAASWHPVGDSAIALSGKVIADPAPDGCGFGAIDSVPAYYVTVNQ